MTWTNSFKNALENPSIAPRYMLNFWGNGANGFTGYGNLNFSMQSGKVRIGTDKIQIQGSSVIPGRWNVALGGFTVPLVGDIRSILPHLQRGMIASLKVDLGAGYERVAMGGLRGITGTPPKFFLHFTDLISAFSNTQNLTVDGTNPTSVYEDIKRGKFTVFSNVGTYSYLTATPGIAPTNVKVNQTSIFVHETGQAGLCKITYSAAGTPTTVYFEFTGRSATSGNAFLTNVSFTGTQVYPEFDASKNILWSLADINDLVYPLAKLKGYPGFILGKLLLSTGAGTNGVLDTLPTDWCLSGGSVGFAQDMFDYNDVSLMNSYSKTPLGNSMLWDLPILEPWTAGLRDFITIAAKTGQWPVIRQGKLSWRGCWNVDNSPVPPAMDISDSDIIAVNKHEFIAPQTSSIYGISSVKYVNVDSQPQFNSFVRNKSGLYNSRVSSLPARTEIIRDNSMVYAGDYLTTAGKNLREDRADADGRRMQQWDYFTYEKLDLKLQLNAAVLCPGDLVTITSKYLYGLRQVENETYNKTVAMVLSVNFSFDRRLCNVVIAIPSSPVSGIYV